MTAVGSLIKSQTGSGAFHSHDEAPEVTFQSPGPQPRWKGERTELLTHPTAPSTVKEVSSVTAQATGTAAAAQQRFPSKPEIRERGAHVRRSTQQYIQLARPLLIKRFLQALDGLAAHA